MSSTTSSGVKIPSIPMSEEDTKRVVEYRDRRLLSLQNIFNLVQQLSAARKSEEKIIQEGQALLKDLCDKYNVTTAQLEEWAKAHK